MSILDYYFRRQILYDYIAGGVMAAYLVWANYKGIVIPPSSDLLYSMVSDLATVSLTLAGFLLTLVTVLISFKSANKVDREDVKETDTVFDIFFASALYFETIRHLKSGIKSLVFVAVLGYSLKLCITKPNSGYLLSFNVAGLAIVVFTLARGITILSQIVNMQRHD